MKSVARGDRPAFSGRGTTGKHGDHDAASLCFRPTSPKGREAVSMSIGVKSWLCANLLPIDSRFHAGWTIRESYD